MFRFLVAIVLTFAAVSGARADCSPFPKSQFIGSFTHAQVANYVEKQMSGDWSGYLASLSANLQRLETLQSSGKETTLKVRGEQVQVSPGQLARFVYVSRQWLAVAQCLSEQQSVAALSDFATAAGGNMVAAGNPVTGANASGERVVTTSGGTGNTSTVTLGTEVARLSGGAVNVQITSACIDGTSVFTVVNSGNNWPKAAKFSIFRLDGPNRQEISARRMSLNKGEAKSFSIPRAKNQTGHVGFAIEPSWYERPFQMDAEISCN